MTCRGVKRCILWSQLLLLWVQSCWGYEGSTSSHFWLAAIGEFTSLLLSKRLNLLQWLVDECPIVPVEVPSTTCLMQARLVMAASVPEVREPNSIVTLVLSEIERWRAGPIFMRYSCSSVKSTTTPWLGLSTGAKIIYLTNSRNTKDSWSLKECATSNRYTVGLIKYLKLA